MKWYKYRAFALLFITKWCATILGVEMVPIPSATAMIKRDGKLLFVNLSYFNGYGFPGGLIKAGEDAETALVREVREETGLEVVSKKFLFTSGSFYRPGVGAVSVIFEVEVRGELHASREGSLVWLEPKDAIDHLAYPNIRPMFERYLKEYF